MPAFNFKKQFAPAVKAGTKKQTIRAKREDCRNPHVDDKLFFYVGQRTKGCRKLGEAICRTVHQITIDWAGVNVDGSWLSPADLNNLAQNDGFKNFYEMKVFFNKEHGLPFDGLLYKW